MPHEIENLDFESAEKFKAEKFEEIEDDAYTKPDIKCPWCHGGGFDESGPICVCREIYEDGEEIKDE